MWQLNWQRYCFADWLTSRFRRNGTLRSGEIDFGVAFVCCSCSWFFAFLVISVRGAAELCCLSWLLLVNIVLSCCSSLYFGCALYTSLLFLTVCFVYAFVRLPVFGVVVALGYPCFHLRSRCGRCLGVMFIEYSFSPSSLWLEDYSYTSVGVEFHRILLLYFFLDFHWHFTSLLSVGCPLFAWDFGVSLLLVSIREWSAANLWILESVKTRCWRHVDTRYLTSTDFFYVVCPFPDIFSVI